MVINKIVITKNNIREYIVREAFRRGNNFHHSLSSKMVSYIHSYLEGYADAILTTVADPVNLDELKGHILEIGFQKCKDIS